MLTQVGMWTWVALIVFVICITVFIVIVLVYPDKSKQVNPVPPPFTPVDAVFTTPNQNNPPPPNTGDGTPISVIISGSLDMPNVRSVRAAPLTGTTTVKLEQVENYVLKTSTNQQAKMTFGTEFSTLTTNKSIFSYKYSTSDPNYYKGYTPDSSTEKSGDSQYSANKFQQGPLNSRSVFSFDNIKMPIKVRDILFSRDETLPPGVINVDTIMEITIYSYEDIVNYEVVIVDDSGQTVVITQDNYFDVYLPWVEQINANGLISEVLFEVLITAPKPYGT